MCSLSRANFVNNVCRLAAMHCRRSWFVSMAFEMLTHLKILAVMCKWMESSLTHKGPHVCPIAIVFFFCLVFFGQLLCKTKTWMKDNSDFKLSLCQILRNTLIQLQLELLSNLWQCIQALAQKYLIVELKLWTVHYCWANQSKAIHLEVVLEQTKPSEIA
jgi:hypothetical protein